MDPVVSSLLRILNIVLIDLYREPYGKTLSILGAQTNQRMKFFSKRKQLRYNSITFNQKSKQKPFYFIYTLISCDYLTERDFSTTLIVLRFIFCSYLLRISPKYKINHRNQIKICQAKVFYFKANIYETYKQFRLSLVSHSEQMISNSMIIEKFILYLKTDHIQTQVQQYNSQVINIMFNMKSPFTQLQTSTGFLNLVYALPFLTSYRLPLLFPAGFSSEVEYNERTVVSKKSPRQTSYNQQYKSQSKANIILEMKQVKQNQKLKYSKISDSQQQTTKHHKKCIQKQTRNINSNLLRIFLKNLIGLKIYNQKIDKIITQLKINIDKEQFYLWIEGFNINFKNYIRTTQICKLINYKQPEHFRKIFITLLTNYSREIGILHCLTSKRIQQSSVKMHLEGLRTLCKDLKEVSQLKK